MTRKKRLRRVAILCCHCLRNLAYYRAGWRNGSLVFQNDFWVNVNGNFLDVCILKWCKLFADARGKHFWKTVVADSTAFYNGLLNELGMTRDQLDSYVAEVRGYRDKFVAHLDSEEVMRPPLLEAAKRSVSYLYDYLLAREDDGGYFTDAPTSSSVFYADVLRKGESIYRSSKFS